MVRWPVCTGAEQETFLVDHVCALDAATVVLPTGSASPTPDGPEPDDPTRNRASITKGWDDRWHLDADLDPVNGAIGHAVFGSIADACTTTAASAT